MLISLGPNLFQTSKIINFSIIVFILKIQAMKTLMKIIWKMEIRVTKHTIIYIY